MKNADLASIISQLVLRMAHKKWEILKCSNLKSIGWREEDRWVKDFQSRPTREEASGCERTK